MSAGRCLLKNGILWDTKKMVDILIDDERIVQIVPGSSPTRAGPSRTS